MTKLDRLIELNAKLDAKQDDTIEFQLSTYARAGFKRAGIAGAYGAGGGAIVGGVSGGMDPDSSVLGGAAKGALLGGALGAGATGAAHAAAPELSRALGAGGALYGGRGSMRESFLGRHLNPYLGKQGFIGDRGWTTDEAKVAIKAYGKRNIRNARKAGKPNNPGPGGFQMMSSKLKRLVELNTKLDEINFDWLSTIGKAAPWRSMGKAALKWGGIGAAGGAITGGIAGGLSEDPDRTALGGALGGAAAGGLLGAAGGAGIRYARVSSRMGKGFATKVGGNAGYTSNAVALAPEARASAVAAKTAAPTAKAAAPAAGTTPVSPVYPPKPNGVRPPAEAQWTSQGQTVADPLGAERQTAILERMRQRNAGLTTYSSRLNRLIQLTAKLGELIAA